MIIIMISLNCQYKNHLHFSARKMLMTFVISLCFAHLYGQEIVLTSKSEFPFLIGDNISILNNRNDKYTATNINLQSGFKKSDKPVLVLTSPKNNVWLTFEIKNQSDYEKLFLSIDYADIYSIKLYECNTSGNLVLIKASGNSLPFHTRDDNSIHFNFSLNLPKTQEKRYYVHVNSNHPYELPIYINTDSTIVKSELKENLIIGLYCGIIVSIILYNLFLFFSTKDTNYFLYVIYLATLWFAQITLEGWSFKSFWPNFASINSYIVISTSCIAGIMAIVFAKSFLNTPLYSPPLNKVLSVLMLFYAAATLLSFTKYAWFSYISFNYLGIIEAVLLLTTSVVVYKKGNTAALFYFIAWSMLLVGFIVHLLKNLNILPFNDLTHFVLYIGSSIEAILLSLALANKINSLRNEKELSQAQALQISQENEQLIQEQNVMLERQVAQRTSDLEKTLRELKDAQIQLVEAEKMASLGQLTAGIAHEINNPINFVKSNVSPLQMDVQDLFELITEYQKLHGIEVNAQPDMLKKIRLLENKLDPDFLKEEIESLIGGIEEGAERTAEIVRGLRNFSRLDESESKEVNVYENINSTLILLRNNVPHYVKVRKHFEARPEIECYPGKLNQVFMNILTNSIHAIKAKPVKNEEEFIDIAVLEEGDYMQIRISDSGIGMTEEVKHKIFEPFFTTKDVGEGTGLGMAIVFKIIEKHNGRISVQSSPGEGATFIIDIPYIFRSEPAMTENEITESKQADL